MSAGAALALTRPLVFVDLETTGTDIATDRIVEIAMVRCEPGGERRRFSTRVNPRVPIPAEATTVHGIRDQDVASCAEFRGIAAGVEDMIAGADFAGFGIARFDLPILRREMMEAGRPFALVGRRVVDALTIFHKKHPRDLAAALHEYCGRDHEKAHSAEADADAAIDVLLAQVEAHGDLRPDVDALHEFCGGDEGLAVDCAGKFVMKGGAVTFAFGKHDGRPLDDVARSDRGFLEWMLGKDFARDTKALVHEALRRTR